MKRIQFIYYGVVTGFSIIGFPGLMKAFNKKLPNVLLLGDSISIGYTPFVKEFLSGKANVYRPVDEYEKPENCLGTQNGILKTNTWIRDGNWDIIHFNFGLHDLKHVDKITGENSNNPEDPRQTNLRHYVKNLKEIVETLKTTKAILIFVTTTPVPSKRVKPFRAPGSVPEYNKAALKLMKKENIHINDLYASTLPLLPEIQRKDNVHFTERGSKVLAEKVSEKISEFL